MTDMMSMPRNTPKNPIVGGVRESEAHLRVHHEPLCPEHAHSGVEEETTADGIDDSNRDVRALGLAVVALAGVRADSNDDAHGGGQRVERGHGELLPETELGVQQDLGHREPLEELVE